MALPGEGKGVIGCGSCCWRPGPHVQGGPVYSPLGGGPVLLFFVVRGRHDTMLSEALGGRLCYSNIVISPVDWPSPIPPYHVALGQGERVSSTLE